MKKIFSIILMAWSFGLMAQPNLPFVGERYFDFDAEPGKSRCALTISIKKNGEATLIYHGGHILYQGPYKKVIQMTDEEFVTFSASKAFFTDKTGEKVEYSSDLFPLTHEYRVSCGM